MHKINFEKKFTKESILKLSSDISYKPLDFGFSIGPCDTTAVKIGIVDSGAINSESYKFSKSHSRRRAMSFLEDNSGVYDQTGHATAVAGIIGASGVCGLTGIAPHSTMYFARCLDEKNNGELSALMSSLLWCMIKKVDIVVVSLGLRYKSRLLQDIIKKLYENNICIFASSGNDLGATKDAEFPARFDEAFACGIGGTSSCSDEECIQKKKYYLNLKNEKITSLDINDGFIKFSGSSSASPVVAGVACHVIESYKREKMKYTVNDVYKSLITNFSTKK